MIFKLEVIINYALFTLTMNL